MLSGAVAQVAQTEAITAADLTRLRVIEALDVSPDGGQVVCVVRGADREIASGQWQEVRQLVLVDLVRDEQAPTQLTHGIRQDVSPEFSPDGRRIAFVRHTEDAGPQVHVMAVDGGEPIRLATVAGGVDPAADVSWSPDGRSLLASAYQFRPAPDAPLGSDAEVAERLRTNVAAGDPRIERSGDHRVFGEDATRVPTLCLLDADDPHASVNYPTTGSARDGVFASGGDALLCTWAIPDDTHPGRGERTVIARIELSGDATPQILSSEPNWDLSRPRLAPDGSAIALLGRARHSALLEPQRLGMVVPGESAPYWLTGDGTMDQSVIEFDWERGADRLLFTSPDDGGIGLSMLSQTLLTEPRDLITAESREHPPVGVGAFSSGGAVIAYARTSVDAPSELWLLNASGQQRRWNPNRWLAQRTLTLPESGWAAPQGDPSVPWWLFRPSGTTSAEDTPLIVLFPPGPGSMWGPGILECWFRSQWLASQGWAVLYANPRGSAGYGRAVRRSIFRDPSRGPSRDMLWAIDSMQEQYPEIGTSRVAMMGSSLGALAAGWSIAAGDVDAVVFENGVFHLPTHIAQHEEWSALIELLGGLPQDPTAHRTMLDSDLLPHLEHMDAPVMLVTMGKNSLAEVESDLLYRLLALSHADVQRIRYAPVPDGPTMHQRLDEADRILIFLQRHLQ